MPEEQLPGTLPGKDGSSQAKQDTKDSHAAKGVALSQEPEHKDHQEEHKDKDEDGTVSAPDDKDEDKAKDKSEHEKDKAGPTKSHQNEGEKHNHGRSHAGNQAGDHDEDSKDNGDKDKHDESKDSKSKHDIDEDEKNEDAEDEDGHRSKDESPHASGPDVDKDREEALQRKKVPREHHSSRKPEAETVVVTTRMPKETDVEKDVAAAADFSWHPHVQSRRLGLGAANAYAD